MTALWPPTASGVLTILLVEDNPADADLILELLDESAAGNGDELALLRAERLADGEARLTEQSVSVVLLDLSLPDSQGLETFRRLSNRFPEAPVVVLSGLDDEALAVEAVRAGAQDYLVKGRVDGDLLVRSLRYAVERKRAEVERARLQQERAAAEAALRARNEVVAGISHDLKNPLSALIGRTQFLGRKVARGHLPDPDELLAALRQVETEASRMQRMLDELLDAARLDAGRPLELRPSRTDLVALAQRAAEVHQSRTDRHSVQVLARELALVGYWDADRLDRVLENLLSNAIKYSPGGGDVTVTLGREANDTGGWAVLSVVDRGIGIPSGDLEHIFAPYFRAANAAGAARGSGIGLAGARRIVEQHGGSISVESREGEGTVITVRLPVSDEAL